MAENLEKKAPNVRFKGFTYDWEQQKLENLVTVNSGRDYKHLSEGNIPVYGTGGYMLSVNEKLSDTDAIGIGRKGTIDKPYILKAPFWTVDTLFYAVPEDNVDLNFMYSIFKKINWKKLDESTGVPSLAKTTINKLKVFIPKEKEQEKIGRLFKYIDTRIFLYQRKIGLLQQLKKAMLQRLFPDTDTYPKLRFGGFSGPWEQHKLGELMDVGSVKRIHQSDWKSSGVRFLRARDIVSLSKNEEPSDVLYIDKHKYDEYSEVSGKVDKGDLLVTGVGSIGVPLLIKSSNPLYFKDGNIIWFKNGNVLNGYFFYYSFISTNIQSFIQKSSGIGTVGTYTIDNGKKTPILVPKDKKEQNQIGLFFNQLDSFIALQQRKLDNMNKLKKFMLQQMFI